MIEKTGDGTLIAITASLPDDPRNLPPGLRTLVETYARVAGVPLPAAWEDMKRGGALLLVNARTKQLLKMDAVDALALYRLIDRHKEDLDAIVYDQLERDAGV
jgi:hypothetical protein